MGRHPDEQTMLMAISPDLMELRTAVVPAITYRERQVVQEGYIEGRQQVELGT
jgi:hypothetical protein